jgi:Neurotransmitter-gated ion-channel ligand binding domain
MNVATQQHRIETVIILLKSFFFAVIAVCAYMPSAPIYSAEAKKAGIADKAMDESVEKIAEKTFIKALDKAINTIVADEAAKSKRPNESKGPTTVHFLVFVLDIDDIDSADQNFTANIYLRLRWQDKRLASPDGTTRQIPLNDVWNPRVLLANQRDRISQSLPGIVQVAPDGTVLYHQRYTGKLSQPLLLAEFPRDRHRFMVQFVGAGYNANELTFVPDNVRNIQGGSMANTLSLADWEVLSYETIVAPYKPIEEVNTAAFAFQFQAKRFISYYLWQVVLPLAVVVIMSWAAFWVGREHLGIRIAVATSSILTLIAHRFILASLLPKLPYMTRLDFFSVGCTLLVLLALITVIIASVLTENNQDRHARKVDFYARGGFPVAFLLLLGWFLFG